MALHWQWNDKMGTATDTRGYKYNLYRGNAFMIGLAEWEKDGEQMWNMAFFFVSEEHARNCLGLSKGYEREDYMENWTFELDTSYSENRKFVQLLARAKVKCTITLY